MSCWSSNCKHFGFVVLLLLNCVIKGANAAIALEVAVFILRNLARVPDLRLPPYPSNLVLGEYLTLYVVSSWLALFKSDLISHLMYSLVFISSGMDRHRKHSSLILHHLARPRAFRHSEADRIHYWPYRCRHFCVVHRNA